MHRQILFSSFTSKCTRLPEVVLQWRCIGKDKRSWFYTCCAHRTFNQP